MNICCGPARCARVCALTFGPGCGLTAFAVRRMRRTPIGHFARSFRLHSPRYAREMIGQNGSMGGRPRDDAHL